MLTYALIAINVIVSLIAFTRMTSPAGAAPFLFTPHDVSQGRNYTGMILSHFSHGDGAHLLFNMITFYYFGPVVEFFLGARNMLLIYVFAGVASTVFVYYLRRNDPNYRALGASDSISGILFAAIVVNPGMDLSIFFVPIPIPAPVFAVAYLAISTYFMKREGGRISHEAHLSGALTGLLLAGMLSPSGFEMLMIRLRNLLS